MIFCDSSPSVSAGAAPSGLGASWASVGTAAVAVGVEGEIKSVTGAGFAGAVDSGFFAAAGLGGAMMREIGGKNERVVPGSLGSRLARGCFSSIRETDSTGGFAFGGAGFSAAAAAAAAAARERAAGVGATVVCRGVLAAVFVAVDFAAAVLVDFFAAGLATADFAAFPEDLRAAVLVVVLVGIVF